MYLITAQATAAVCNLGLLLLLLLPELERTSGIELSLHDGHDCRATDHACKEDAGQHKSKQGLEGVSTSKTPLTTGSAHD
jgi:hypothetical protein